MITSSQGYLPIAFDIDGIALDTSAEMWRAITKEKGVDWSIERWTDYELGKLFDCDTKDLRPIYEPILRRENIPEVQGAGKALTRLWDNYSRPILFVTSRRSEFKLPAVRSLRKILRKDVKYDVLCTGESGGSNHHDDKLPFLKEYNIRLFVEDNWEHWERYIDGGVEVATLALPWTKQPFIDLVRKKKYVKIHPDWKSLYSYMDMRLATWIRG